MKRYIITLLASITSSLNAAPFEMYIGAMTGITHMQAKGVLDLRTYNQINSVRNGFNYTHYRNKLSPHFILGANIYKGNLFYGLEINVSPFDNLESNFSHTNDHIIRSSLGVKDTYGISLRGGFDFERDKTVYLKVSQNYRSFEQKFYHKELIVNNVYQKEDKKSKKLALWGIGGGIEKRFSNAWALRAEYNITPFNLKNFAVDQKIGRSYRDNFSVKAKGYIHNFLIGVSYRFV